VSVRQEKILALQFKYLGDAVLMTPALRALREHFLNGELHVLVPEEIAPLLKHLPWLDHVWPMPRRRGRANFGQSWPVIRALRREKFDRSADFASNDRGAILSFLIGARQRLGWNLPGGFFGRRFCYNQRPKLEIKLEHESARNVNLLSAWGIVARSLEPEIRSDPALDAAAEKLLPAGAVICHIASSQPKKEWPLAHWAAFYQIATSAGIPLVFNTGGGGRERALLDDLQKQIPGTPALSPSLDRATFLAVLNRARAFISGDTGPLHFAAGLGVPTIALFGPTPAERWAPIGPRHQVLTGSKCGCDGNSAVCSSANHCLAAISPENVFSALDKIFSKNIR